MRLGMVTASVIAAVLGGIPAPAARPLVAHFVADRVLVDGPLEGGGHVRFWTDTGGGSTLLYAPAVARLRLKTAPFAGKGDDIPPGAREVRDPLPLGSGAFPPPPMPALVVPDQIGAMGGTRDCDGNLGQDWFAGHVWTWDYPRGTLAIEDAGRVPPKGAHVVAIGFKPAKPGVKTPHFPRLPVVIAGERMDMLLDTGATTVLTPEAVTAIGGGPKLRATSMIGASHIAAWRRAHPDWPVIEKAQGGSGARMIRVPDVRIAGFQVGPVWFTERPDRNFAEWISTDMDGVVQGAIGGNAFHTLRMTVDYPHARAAFAQER